MSSSTTKLVKKSPGFLIDKYLRSLSTMKSMESMFPSSVGNDNNSGEVFNMHATDNVSNPTADLLDQEKLQFYLTKLSDPKSEEIDNLFNDFLRNDCAEIEKNGSCLYLKVHHKVPEQSGLPSNAAGLVADTFGSYSFPNAPRNPTNQFEWNDYNNEYDEMI